MTCNTCDFYIVVLVLLDYKLPPLVQRNDSNLEGWVDTVATVESGGPDVVLKCNNGVHDRRLVQS